MVAKVVVLFVVFFLSRVDEHCSSERSQNSSGLRYTCGMNFAGDLEKNVIIWRNLIIVSVWCFT